LDTGRHLNAAGLGLYRLINWRRIMDVEGGARGLTAWVGIDCGYSQMSIAVLDQDGHVLAIERTRLPRGDGHSGEVALARVLVLLERLHGLSHPPARLAGYCYDHSGVVEAFRGRGWTVIEAKPLNDVVGIYGLTDMRGNVVVGGCGSWPQVVYIDQANAVCWPGEDVAAEMPEWQLSGWRYAGFLKDLSKRNDLGRWSWLKQAVIEKLRCEDLDRSRGNWGALGPLLPEVLEHVDARRFLSAAADAVVETRNVLWKHSGCNFAPGVVIGGGAVSDERIWALLHSEFESRSIEVERAEGDPAVGLARFAMKNPHADAWAFLGQVKPSWLR
jgi:hypothetical protein